MLRINYFWKAVKMTWLSKLTYLKSNWAVLHKAETKWCTFDLMTSNLSKIELARSKMDNLVWKEIYGTLLACSKNIVKASPLEFISLPVNGEPYITGNNVAMQQAWCENFTINDILDKYGRFKKPEDYPPRRRPVFFMKTLRLKMP